MSEGFGAGSARDWTAPRDAAALSGMLRAFEGMLDGLPLAGAMAASCPSWYDDTGSSDRRIAAAGSAAAETDSGWWGFEKAETAAEDAAGTAAWVDKCLAGAPGPDALAVRALLAAAAPGGALCRDAVEAAALPMEAEEIAAFCMLACGRGLVPALLVSHTNGYTDAAYGLMPDGTLLCWPDARTRDAVKKGRLPHLPDPRLGIRAAPPSA